ncbi:MAG: glycosyltransferase family 39 protein, partial [Planctomycetes bacterium]|nr:glycosyltransferase family 39 protein [Planctomycetota bacterium]
MSAPPPANEPNEPGEPSRPIVRSRWTRRDRFWVAALALAAIAFYAGLGALLHPFAIPGPEWDGYVARARDLASGGTGYSATHPYGLPVLLAGLQLAGLDAFVAGRLVAAVAGGVLVAATCRLARDYVGWPAALVGALAVGVTGVVCEHAMLACSDMPAAGALAFALVCWSAAARRSDAALGPVALGGVGVGLAMAFRFPSLFAAAGLLVLLATGPWSRRALRALAAGAGAVLGLLPQLWASARASGALFGNDNWRNLVFKYQHGFDLRLAVLERDQ